MADLLNATQRRMTVELSDPGDSEEATLYRSILKSAKQCTIEDSIDLKKFGNKLDKFAKNIYDVMCHESKCYEFFKILLFTKVPQSNSLSLISHYYNAITHLLVGKDILSKGDNNEELINSACASIILTNAFIFSMLGL